MNDKTPMITEQQSNQINQLSEDLSNIVKITLIIGTALGFVSLIYYTSEHSIPLPINLSQLPTLLISIFVLTLVYSFIIMGFFIMPAMNRYVDIEPYFELFSDKNLLGKIFVYMGIIGVPFLAILISMLTYDTNFITSVITIIIGVATLVLSHIKLVSKKSIGHYMYLVPLLFVSFFWIIMILLVLLKFISNNFLNLDILTEQIIIVASFLLVLALLGIMLIPSKRKKEKTNNRFWSAIAISTIILFTLHPYLNTKMVGAALSSMNIGGEIPIVLTFRSGKNEIPEGFFNPKNKSISKELLLMLEVDKSIYVKIKGSENMLTHEIPKEYYAFKTIMKNKK